MQISGEGENCRQKIEQMHKPRGRRVPDACRGKQQAPVADMELAGRESQHITSER